MATALGLAQDRYDYMSDDQDEHPDTAAVNALLQQHPDFQLTQANVENGLRAISTAQWDDLFADVQTFMRHEDNGSLDLMRAKGLAIATYLSSLVRGQWKADAEQMHEDMTKGYEQ